VTSSFNSTVQGLGTANYVSTATLQSTVFGLNVYISSFIDVPELTSTIIGLGTNGYVSTTGLLSTATGLASYIVTFINPSTPRQTTSSALHSRAAVCACARSGPQARSSRDAHASALTRRRARRR
jgi:hypothetical protein